MSLEEPAGAALARRLGTFSPRADGSVDPGGQPTDAPAGTHAHLFTGAELAAMGRIACVDIPRLVDRFETELAVHLATLRTIDARARRRLRQVA